MSSFVLNDGLWSCDQEVPLFGQIIKIYILPEKTGAPTSRQLKISTSLFNLPETLLSDMKRSAVTHYHEIDKIVNLENEGISIDASQIDNHFRITSILIPEVGDCDTNYFFVSADCDWEPEHGTQFLVEDNRVIWCGEQTSLPFGGKWLEIIRNPFELRRPLFDKYLK